jgi:hypothetical protein
MGIASNRRSEYYEVQRPAIELLKDHFGYAHSDGCNPQSERVAWPTEEREAQSHSRRCGAVS